jgi:hypothetical protein
MAKKSKKESKVISPRGWVKIVVALVLAALVLVPAFRYTAVNGFNNLVGGVILPVCLLLLIYFIFKKIKNS